MISQNGNAVRPRLASLTTASEHKAEYSPRRQLVLQEGFESPSCSTGQHFQQGWALTCQPKPARTAARQTPTMKITLYGWSISTAGHGVPAGHKQCQAWARRDRLECSLTSSGRGGGPGTTLAWVPLHRTHRQMPVSVEPRSRLLNFAAKLTGTWLERPELPTMPSMSEHVRVGARGTGSVHESSCRTDPVLANGMSVSVTTVRPGPLGGSAGGRLGGTDAIQGRPGSLPTALLTGSGSRG